MVKQNREKYWWSASSALKVKGASVLWCALYYLFFLLMSNSSCLGQNQNLVPNPGFEEHNTCQYFVLTPGVGYPVDIVYSPNYDISPSGSRVSAALSGL